MWRWMSAAVGVPVRLQWQWRCWGAKGLVPQTRGARGLFGWSRDKEARMKKKQEL